MTKPLVSIITAVYNGEKHIEDAIKSVINQTYENIEYIIIDGGSTDSTPQIVHRYRDAISHFVSEKDKGIADAWNKGLALAKGDFIAFLNADDYYLPNFISESISHCDRNEELVVIYGNTVLTENEIVKYSVCGKFDERRINLGLGFLHPSCITSKKAFDTLGNFNLDYKIAIDSDFLLRCIVKKCIFIKSNATVVMRLGGISDKQWVNACKEYNKSLLQNQLISEPQKEKLDKLIFLRNINRKFGLAKRARKIKAQIYFLLLWLINMAHSIAPFFISRLIFKLCGYKISPSATIASQVKFFHVGRLSIGSNSVINNSVYLDNREAISIGKNVLIAHDSKLYTLGHNIHSSLFEDKGGPISIDDDAVIFSNSLIMPNVSIGKGAVVMAGSVVIKDVEPYTIVGGNPAQNIGVRSCTPLYSLDYRFWKSH